MLEWLQQWYNTQCDGDWEHEYGVKITTIDNPGWSVVIDLTGTKLEGIEVPYKLEEISPDVWRSYSITKDVFDAGCSPSELLSLIKVFKKIWEQYDENKSR
ncbi:MAG: immunity 53 family protein [Chitinophagaceae bacterium]